MIAVTGLPDRAGLRTTFGTFATGITVVTVGGARPHGMTANSFTTVSLDPALVLVCVGHDAIMHEALAENGRFGVSILASGQEEIARHFADNRRPLGSSQFDFVPWVSGPDSGAPLIDGAVAHYECELWRGYDGGDHTIFVGRLLSVRRCNEEDVLIYLRGRFRQLEQMPRDLVG